MKFILSCLIALPLVCAAQIYTIDTSIPVIIDDRSLINPWAGGINAGQYNTMDMNNDGRDDLVIFDRTSAQIKVFVATAQGYIYEPLMALHFPAGMNSWVLLRDFNCDGRKDIFTSDPLGIKVYVNESDTDGFRWRIFNERPVQAPLLTKGFSERPINLQMNSSDIPAIDDIDGDGDLDILVFRFSSRATIEYHKNLSIENTGVCDSLQLERVTQAWGDFEECLCGSFAFNGEDCPETGGGRTEHQSGKSIFTIDMDGDGDREVVIGEESCGFFSILTNEGTQEEADFNSFSNLYPNTDNPVAFNQFPAGYYEDVDADGIKDLIAAPNVPGNVGFGVNFAQSSWWYKNNGTNSNPNFTFVQRDFLQDQMIDVGENAVPAFYDYDNDGDLDMFVGAFLANITAFNSTIMVFDNIGSASNPTFELAEDDLFSISQAGLINLKPVFTDVDSDGLVDFVFTATVLDNGSTNLFYLKRNSTAFDFDFDARVIFPSIGINEQVKLYDIDSDGDKDLLWGRSTGRVEYYTNNGMEDAFDFQLVDESFYDLDFSPFRQFTTMDIADLDGDDKADFIIGDARGNITLFRSFLDHLEEPLEGITDIFRISETATGAISPGSKVQPVVVNLFNENLPAIAFGTGQGGITIVRNEGATINPSSGAIGVYPNPVKVNEFLTINSLQNTSVGVVNILGQTIISNIQLVANEPTVLQVDNLKEGLYLLVSEDGSESAIRFVVVR